MTPGFNAPLTALDAATGQTVTTYPQSRFTDEILYREGTLVLAVNHAATGPGRIKAKPPVKKPVVAINAATGELLWKTGDFVGVASKADAIERVTHLTMALGGGKVFLVEEDAVVALSRKTGKRACSTHRRTRASAISRPSSTGSGRWPRGDGSVLLSRQAASRRDRRTLRSHPGAPGSTLGSQRAIGRRIGTMARGGCGAAEVGAALQIAWEVPIGGRLTASWCGVSARRRKRSA